MSPLLQMLIRHEGLKLKVYKCPAGKLSIGVGRNLEDLGITKEEAIDLAENDIRRCHLELYENFEWYKRLDHPRQDALIDMVFNLGLPRFLGFRKMINALSMGWFEEAAKEALDSEWAKQVHGRAHEIASMVRTGKYINGEEKK